MSEFPKCAKCGHTMTCDRDQEIPYCGQCGSEEAVAEPRNPIHEADVNAILNLPPVKWAEFIEGLKGSRRNDLSSALMSWSAHLATAFGYVAAREHGRDHHKAIKEMNRTRKNVRKALGYTYPKDDLNFPGSGDHT